MKRKELRLNTLDISVGYMDSRTCSKCLDSLLRYMNLKENDLKLLEQYISRHDRRATDRYVRGPGSDLGVPGPVGIYFKSTPHHDIEKFVQPPTHVVYLCSSSNIFTTAAKRTSQRAVYAITQCPI